MWNQYIKIQNILAKIDEKAKDFKLINIIKSKLENKNKFS